MMRDHKIGDRILVDGDWYRLTGINGSTSTSTFTVDGAEMARLNERYYLAVERSFFVDEPCGACGRFHEGRCLESEG